MAILLIIQRTRNWFIRTIFHFGVWIITRFFNMKPFEEKVAIWRKYPEGTVANDISKCLDGHGLRLVPFFESHDLKHVLLGFDMTSVDEIRLQAFMIGNGNRTVASFVIFAFGILMPEAWPLFLQDFRRGREAIRISSWQIEDFAHEHTVSLREHIISTQHTPKPLLSLASLTKAGAFASIAAGLFGMAFCAPYLFSAALADLVGAGFPFVGGAILLAGGLVTLSNLARDSRVAGANVG